MQPTHKIAAKVMESLDAFHGSKPAIDTENILIVRGISPKKFEQNEMETFLSNLLKDLGAREVDIFSKEGGNLIGVMDERIRSSVMIQTETNISGLHKMKESLESMGCDVEYILGARPDLGIFIISWMDKSGIGPRFVEVVVSNLE